MTHDAIRMIGLWFLIECLALLPTPVRADDWGEPALEITHRTARKIEGKLAYAGALISFKASLEKEKVAVVNILVNGWPYDARTDATEKTRLDGHDGALMAEERIALMMLDSVLGPVLKPFAKRPRHEVLLSDYVAMLSEAPVGFTHSAQEIAPPSKKNKVMQEEPAHPDGLTPLELERQQFPALQSSENQTAAAGSCQRSGEAGVVTIPCGSRYPVYATTCHDAAHCYQCYGGAPMGPKSSGCYGRCGPGCGNSTRCGRYGLDCADHDYCCQAHGGCLDPNDPECGDEFKEASDDFLRAGSCCG